MSKNFPHPTCRSVEELHEFLMKEPERLPLCICGCGERVLPHVVLNRRCSLPIAQIGSWPKKKKGHSKHSARNQTAPLCECGCGEYTKWSRSTKNWRRFIAGHHLKLDQYKTPERPYMRGDANPMKRPEIAAKLSGDGNWRRRPEKAKEAAAFAQRQSERLTGPGNHMWKGGESLRPRMSYEEKQRKHSIAMTGANNPAYIDGRSYDPEHQKYKFAWRDRQSIREHRAVMEEAIERKLLPGEIVHHKDENRLNNDINHRKKPELTYKYAEVHSAVL